MTPTDGVSRRTAVKLAGIAAVPVVAAGCTSDGSDDSGDDVEYVEDEPDYDGWFDDVPNYDETVDRTGVDEVTVMVGTGDTNVEFDPPAVRVDEGTTVVWEWTGDGGRHDVVDTDDAFESEMKKGEGETFEHAFEETGVYTYVCVPHESMGMKGAVDVV